MKKFITVVGTAAVVVLGALGVKKFVSDLPRRLSLAFFPALC